MPGSDGIEGKMHYFESIAALFALGLVVSYFTFGSQRARQTVFLTACAIGAGLGAYGMVKAAQTDKPYFQAVGLPLATTVVIVLCFAVIMLHRTFTASSLKNWVYPTLCWYFAAWILLDDFRYLWNTIVRKSGTFVGIRDWRVVFRYSDVDYSSVSLFAYFFSICLMVAFILAAIRNFNLRWFQIFLPIVFILFLLWVVHDSTFLLRPGIKLPELTPDEAEAFRAAPGKGARYLFFTYFIWGLFFIFGYLYFHGKVHIKRLQQNYLTGKLPTTSVLLIISSLFFAFPEYAHFRKLFPGGSEIFETVMMISDIGLIPLFLGGYWWLKVNGRDARTPL